MLSIDNSLKCKGNHGANIVTVFVLGINKNAHCTQEINIETSRVHLGQNKPIKVTSIRFRKQLELTKYMNYNMTEKNIFEINSILYPS